MKTLSHKFKNKRKQKGLTFEQVASDIKVNKNYIEIFESGDFKDKLDKIYINGFIRSYANYLGLDSKKMLNLYKDSLVDAKKPSSKYKDFFKPKIIFFNQGERVIKTNKAINLICCILLVFFLSHSIKESQKYQDTSSNIVNSIIYGD